MYLTLKRLYQESKITETHLSNAVVKGWITAIEKQEMMSQ